MVIPSSGLHSHAFPSQFTHILPDPSSFASPASSHRRSSSQRATIPSGGQLRRKERSLSQRSVNHRCPVCCHPTTSSPVCQISRAGVHDGPFDSEGSVRLSDDCQVSASITHRIPLVDPKRPVELSSIPSHQSRRLTTIFVGQAPLPAQSRFELSSDPPAHGLRDVSTRHKSRGGFPDTSDMHRPVNRDDYLLARGANPRTGVVTPGSHSASSSIDQDEVKRAHGPALPSRWRQRGDQWVSLDLDEPSPSTTPAADKLLDHSSPALSLSQPLTHDHGKLRALPVQSPSLIRAQALAHSQASERLSHRNEATSHIHPPPHSEGIGTVPEIAHSSTLQREPDSSQGSEHKLRRKPVGSPPTKQLPNQEPYQHEDSSDSTETVVRKLRFPNDLRSSSAPDAPRRRNFTPADVGKDLPSLPKDRPLSGGNQEVAESTESPFLGRPMLKVRPNGPDSRTSDTSGHPLVEKELPCPPMNNGQFQSKPGPTQSLSVPPPGVTEQKTVQSLYRQRRPQGPRGGDPAYPFMRTIRPIYPQPQIQPQSRPLGERLMPIPTYDNPPMPMQAIAMTTGTSKAGPEYVPQEGPTKMSQEKDPFNPSLNTTSIPTNMSMEHRSIPPPSWSGPKPSVQFPSHRMMNQDRLGFPTILPPTRPFDTSMSTDMITDSIMSIPMQRVRPRADSRPQMPMRAKGMLYVPRLDPMHDQLDIARVDYRIRQNIRGRNATIQAGSQPDGVCLVPQPLRPRAHTEPEGISPSHPAEDSTPLREGKPTSPGITRRCSRCHNGFTVVRPHNTDGVTPTSAPQNPDDASQDFTKPAHPMGRALLAVPREKDDANDDGQSSKQDDLSDERDHSICCPDCCKNADCHEGCLGHPSPSSTPNTSPTKSIWSRAGSPSSASEVEDWENERDLVGLMFEKPRSGRLALVKSAFKRSPKKRQAKLCSDGNSSLGQINGRAVSPTELSAPLPTPSVASNSESGDNKTDGLNAAMVAAGSPKRKASSRLLHKRQRSSSSPVVAVGAFPRKTSPSHSPRSVSGPRLRVSTPQVVPIACSVGPKSRNVSGNSVSTLELQVPGLGSLGFRAVVEMVVVPFEATKMWIHNHPQVMTLGWEVLERGWFMSQIITATGWRLWTLIFVYSKTGKLNLKMAKGETACGFVIECARSVVYLLIFFAVGALVMRVLNILFGALTMIGWLMKGLFWILRQILGLGLAR